MRRYYAMIDRFYRFVHCVKRNKGAVILYGLTSAVFLVIGVAVGIKAGDKSSYITQSGSAIFKYLRGDIGAAAFFFFEFFISLLYDLVALSLFFTGWLSLLSFAPCMYRSYVLGLNVCVTVAAYSASALPMLFVFFVPTSLVEIAVCCILSYRCRAFAALNRRCLPSLVDVKCHYASAIPYGIASGVLALVKAVSVALFGSALIGIV